MEAVIDVFFKQPAEKSRVPAEKQFFEAYAS
jgi:hypothetical protein